MNADQIVDNIIASSELREVLTSLVSMGLNKHYKPPSAYKSSVGRFKDKSSVPSLLEDNDDPTPGPHKVTARVPKGTLVLVTDYSRASHAIFGDFEGEFSSLKQKLDHLRESGKEPKLYWSPKLNWGRGFCIGDKSRLQPIAEFIRKQNVKLREVGRSRFELECKGELEADESESESTKSEHDDAEDKIIVKPDEGSSSEESESEETKVNSKEEPESESDEDSSSESEPPKPIKEHNKPELEVNKWKNLWHVETRLVFVEDNKVCKCIGKQDKKCRKKGIVGVMKLTDDDIETCKENRWLFDKTYIS